MLAKGPYPFADKRAQYRQYTPDMLAFALKDAREARDVCGTHDSSCWGYYQDDALTVLAELERRRATRMV
jgi:hypothetical protein